MGGLLERLREWTRSGGESYAVDEYVLARVEPDPEQRLRAYDEAVAPEDVDAAALPPGRYHLQAVKASGMAGEVVWEAELGGDGGDDATG